MDGLFYLFIIFVVPAMIYALYHCSTNKRIKNVERPVYMLGIVLIPVIGIVFYFKQDQKKMYQQRIQELKQAKKDVKNKNERNTRKNAGVATFRHRFRKTRKKR